MPYFNVGDTVHVRTDLEEDVKYYMGDHENNNYYYIDQEMAERFGGSACTIESASDRFYRLSGDHNDWFWTDEMLMEYIERNMKDFEQPTKAELLSLLGI